MFGASEKPEAVARAVREAECAAQEAVEAAAQVEAASRETLAEGKANAREEAVKVMEAKLRTSPLWWPSGLSKPCFLPAGLKCPPADLKSGASHFGF